MQQPTAAALKFQNELFLNKIPDRFPTLERLNEFFRKFWVFRMLILTKKISVNSHYGICRYHLISLERLLRRGCGKKEKITILNRNSFFPTSDVTTSQGQILTSSSRLDRFFVAQTKFSLSSVKFRFYDKSEL